MWVALACGACNDVTLTRGLSEPEAQRLSAQLNRRGIAVTQSADGEGFALQIAESALPTAWATAAAQCGPTLPPPTAAAPLLSTRDAELRAEGRRLEAQLSAAIEALPNVRSADLLITLARPDNMLSDLLRPPVTAAPRAVVSLLCDARGACPSAEQLQPLLDAAVPGLSSSNIRVLQTPAQPELECAELGHIGPLTVTRASLPNLKLWFAASLVLHMFGSLALLLVVQRKRRQ